MVRLASEGLRSGGAASPSKSVCSILPLARHLRAGEGSSMLTSARDSAIERRMMYKEQEAEARVVQMSPILRGLAEEMLRRGNQFDHRVPLDEALDSDLEEQLRLALSEPALKQEWEEFWQALSDAAEEDIEAIHRGEHDHEL